MFGLIAVGLAHLAPLHLVQKTNGVLLDTFADTLPLADGGNIVFVDASEPARLGMLGAGSVVTAVSPSLFAVGPIETPAFGEAAAWIAAIGAILLLLEVRTRHQRYAGILAVSGPVVLLGSSAMAFAMTNSWVPVAGPILLILVTGFIAVTAKAPIPAAGVELPREPKAALDLLHQGHLIDAWHAYRELPPTESLLPELYDLGNSLAAEDYPELAADAFMRAALVDPEYRDLAKRLVRAGRMDTGNDAAREELRRQMPEYLGRYKLLEPIGQGTTGRVYLARDPSINRLLAIKLIDLTRERDEDETADAIERFHREAETTGRLSHPNIVTVFDMGESEGRAYIAMEYVKGDLLSRFTGPDRLLPPSLVLGIGARVADALDYAHRQNVIHRDIKPANIMYDSVSGDLKITDFGIARLIHVNRTRTGIVLGTPSFMAPEQIEGGNVKGHTDLFALGVTLYELLTGQLPFRGTSMTKLMFVIANEPHEPLSVVRSDLPVEIDAVMDMALHKEPTSRFRRGADMADALRAAARMVA